MQPGSIGHLNPKLSTILILLSPLIFRPVTQSMIVCYQIYGLNLFRIQGQMHQIIFIILSRQLFICQYPEFINRIFMVLLLNCPLITR
jgi:hypothetical protein